MSWVVWLLGAAAVVGLVVVAALGWLERRAYTELVAGLADKQRRQVDAQARLIETNRILIDAQRDQIRLLEARAEMAASERKTLWDDVDELWESVVGDLK